MVKRADFDFNLFRAMEVFVAVVETHQVTKAAALLGMTQSAASQNLRSLENALGAKLFDRSTRPVALTRAGITLQKHATRILNEIEQLTAEIQRLESLPLPVLRIGLLASIATTLTPQLIQIVRGRFKVPELTLHAGLATDHYELLTNRRADIVITSEPFYDSDGLERHSLLREPFFLVVPAGMEGEAADFEAFSKTLAFARFTPQSPVGRKIDQHLRRVRCSFPAHDRCRPGLHGDRRGRRRPRIFHHDSKPVDRRPDGGLEARGPAPADRRLLAHHHPDLPGAGAGHDPAGSGRRAARRSQGDHRRQGRAPSARRHRPKRLRRAGAGQVIAPIRSPNDDPAPLPRIAGPPSLRKHPHLVWWNRNTWHIGRSFRPLG